MRIHAIQTGTVEVKRRQLRGVGPGPLRAPLTILDRRWTEPLPVLAWLIEHPEGLVVVDTGTAAQAAQRGYFPWWSPYLRFALRLRIESEQEIGPQIERLGFSPLDVRRVVMTHMHADHTGGLHELSRSEVLASRTELALTRRRDARLRGYLTDRWPTWLDPVAVDFDDGPFGPFERSHVLTRAGDVVLLPTPGHTAGHLSVAVRTGGPLVVLAGDATYSETLLLEGTADGVTADPSAHRRSTGLLRELVATQPAVVLPTHDPGSVARLQRMQATAIGAGAAAGKVSGGAARSRR